QHLLTGVKRKRLLVDLRRLLRLAVAHLDVGQDARTDNGPERVRGEHEREPPDDRAAPVSDAPTARTRGEVRGLRLASGPGGPVCRAPVAGSTNGHAPTVRRRAGRAIARPPQTRSAETTHRGRHGPSPPAWR